MDNSKRLFVLIVILVPFFALHAKSTENDGDESGTEISAKESATNIARISRDTVVVITGSTYSYTVDTPEGEGLVSTGITAKELPLQIKSKNGSTPEYKVKTGTGALKTDEELETGDRLIIEAKNGKTKTYYIDVQHRALSGQLQLQQENVTVNTNQDLTLNFTAGQRSPDATVRVYLPEGIKATMENTTVNVIGRGSVQLKDLSTQSIGNAGSNYSYSKVGEVTIEKAEAGGSVLRFKHIDLRPSNGVDLKIVIHDINLSGAGEYAFRATYTTSKPEVLRNAGTGPETATLTVVKQISDFRRILDKKFESQNNYAAVNFSWTSVDNTPDIQLMQSLDKGKSWSHVRNAEINAESGTARVSGLQSNRPYTFRLSVKNGEHKGYSNSVRFYSGRMDVKRFGVTGDGNNDDTRKINEAIDYLHELGGGILLFSNGVYNVRTVHLKSNVWLYVAEDATIKALKGADAPEATWFSDKQYRSGLSPTARGPYKNPENWLTKQDVGHTYFRNTMFFGKRVNNVKIIGTGRITGDGNLVTSDHVMDREPDNRADKMVTCKLCTNIEIGGLRREEDLWYDPDKDEPYYIDKNGRKDYQVDNMLNIDQGGHFALLATGSDSLDIHDIYFAKASGSNARDIFDFMETSNVGVTNIYSKVSSDDIVKLGSDCSLGFTRPAHNFRIRNIIGDTNCNLFQIGSETADDITGVYVDNIYVLGANKAGFSISTNDGAHVSDVYLNYGYTGVVHSRSKMRRTRAPFFISISNRGRILGAEVGRYKFTENGKKHDELLVKNVNIGEVENINIKGVDISEVYGGSSYRHKDVRWKPYDGSQHKAAPIVAGYKLPESSVVEGGLDFGLPNGRHTGYITNIEFEDIHVLVKGGNPPSDTLNLPPELGVGQYNVSNLGVQPSYGLWARHVKGLTIKRSSFNYEKRDSRYVLLLDDVVGSKITGTKMVSAKDNDHIIKLKHSSDITLNNVIYFNDEWGHKSTKLPRIHHSDGDEIVAFPRK